MQKKNRLLISLTLSIIISSLILATFWMPSSAQTSDPVKNNVLYVGNSLGNVYDALSLDKENMDVQSQKPQSLSFADLDNFDVVVLNDANLSTSDLATLSSWAAIDGHGVMIIMGAELTQENSILSTFGFTTDTHFSNNTGKLNNSEDLQEKKGLCSVNPDLDPSLSPILSMVWNSAPEIFYFTLIPNLQSEVITYVKMQWNNGKPEVSDYPLVAGIKVGDNSGPNVYLYSGWLQEEFDNVEANEHFMVWPYFNYLMFSTAQASIGNQVPEYGYWKYSPVPHLTSQIFIGALVFITGVVSVWLYVRARKHKKSHREIFLASDIDTSESEQNEEIIEEIKDKSIYIDKNNDWEAIGFHRQISGFFKLFFVMILLLIPQLLVTSIVMPRFLNPYPQASGWYSYTLHFFQAIWLVFDMGFNFAIVKYFSQHRIERPEKAFHYVQLFIWWEILSGVAQIFLIAFVGSIVFPMTNMAYLSWMFVIHSLIQFPGFFLVFQYFFQGYQRADLSQIVFALQYFVLRMAIQLITVPLFRAIFSNNVVYGAAFGCGIGLLVGQMLGDMALFGISLKMYRNMQLPLKPVFRADFTKEEFRETLTFGAKMVAGEVWVPAVWLLQVFLVGVFLPNSSAEQGYFELAFTIATVPAAISLLMNSMMGGLTEAHVYKKKNLLNYTSFSGMKWGSIWTLYLVSVFWAIGKEFIIGASGPNWARAADLIPLLMIFQILGPISWQGDNEFAAANKPGYAGLAWIVEQIVRAAALYLLLSTMLKMEAVVLAYIIALAIKDVLVLYLIRKKIHTWPWNPWQAFIAPALSAIVNYFIIRGIVFILVDRWLGYGIISAMLLFIIGLFVMEHVYSFFVGLFGGYDDNTMKELDRATKMVTGVRFLTRIYYNAALLGAKISPLHNKFKVEIYEEAQKEAEELTAIKKKVVL